MSTSNLVVTVVRTSLNVDWGMTHIIDPIHNICRIASIAPLSPIFKTNRIKVGAAIQAINGIVIRPGVSISDIINGTLKLKILVDNTFCSVPLPGGVPRQDSEVIDLLFDSDDSDDNNIFGDDDYNSDHYGYMVLPQNGRVITPSNVLRPISRTTIDLVSSDDEVTLPKKTALPYAPSVTKKRKSENDIVTGKKFGGKVVKNEYQINAVGFGEANYGDEVIEVLASNETGNQAGDIEIIDHSEAKKIKSNSNNNDNCMHGGDDDIEFLGGNMAVLADMAHQRESCSINKFYCTHNHPDNLKHCNNCWCYICDSLVQECTEWNRHAHAYSKSVAWREEKNSRKSFIKTLLDPKEFNQIYATSRAAFMMNVDHLSYTNGSVVCTSAINFAVSLLPKLVIPFDSKLKTNTTIPRVSIIHALFLLNQANKAPSNIKQQSSFAKIPQYFAQIMLHPYVDQDIKLVFHKELAANDYARYLDSSSNGFILKLLRNAFVKDPAMKWNVDGTCDIVHCLRHDSIYWRELRSHDNVLSRFIDIFCSNRDLKALSSLQAFDKSISLYIIFKALMIDSTNENDISLKLTHSTHSVSDRIHKFEFIKQLIVDIGPSFDWNATVIPKDILIEVAKQKLVLEMVFVLQFLSKQSHANTLKIIEMSNIVFFREINYGLSLSYNGCVSHAKRAAKWTEIFSTDRFSDWICRYECKISTLDSNKFISPILALYIDLHLRGNFDKVKNLLFITPSANINLTFPLDFLILFMHAYLHLLSATPNEISLDLSHKIAKYLMNTYEINGLSTFMLVPYSIIELWSSMDDVYSVDSVDTNALSFNECRTLINRISHSSSFIQEYYTTHVQPKIYLSISEWKVVLILKLFWKTWLFNLTEKNLVINFKNKINVQQFLTDGVEHLKSSFSDSYAIFESELRSKIANDTISAYDTNYAMLRILVATMKQQNGLFIGPVTIWSDVIRSIKNLCLTYENIKIWKCWENILSTLVRLSRCSSVNECEISGNLSIYDLIIGRSYSINEVRATFVPQLIENISELKSCDIISSSSIAEFVISLLVTHCTGKNEQIVKAIKHFCSSQKIETTIFYSLIAAKPTEVVDLLARLMNPQVILILSGLYKHRNFTNRMNDLPAPVVYFYSALGIDILESQELTTPHNKALFSSFENTYESLYNNVKITSYKLMKSSKKSVVNLLIDFNIFGNLEDIILCLTYLELEVIMAAILAKFYKRPSELANPKTDKRIVIPHDLVKKLCEYAVNSHEWNVIDILMLYISDIYLVGGRLDIIQTLILNTEQESNIIVYELKVYHFTDLTSIEGFINNVNNDKVKINRVVQWIKDMYFLGKITLEVYLSMIISYFSTDYLAEVIHKFSLNTPVLQPEAMVKILNYLILLLAKDEVQDELYYKIAILLGYVNEQIIQSKTNIGGLGIKEKIVLIYNQYINQNNHIGANIAGKWLVPTSLEGIMMSHDNSICFMKVIASTNAAHVNEAISRNMLNTNLCTLLIDQNNMALSIEVLWDTSKTIIMEKLLLLCYDVSQSLISHIIQEQLNMDGEYTNTVIGHGRSGLSGCAHIIAVLDAMKNKITKSELSVGKELFNTLFYFGEESADINITQFLILVLLSLNETIYILGRNNISFEYGNDIADKISDMTNHLNRALTSFTSHLMNAADNNSFFVAIFNFFVNPDAKSVIELQKEAVDIASTRSSETAFVSVSEFLNKCIIMLFTNFDCNICYTIHKFVQLCRIFDLAKSGKLDYFTILIEDITNLSIAVLRKPSHLEMIMMNGGQSIQCTTIVLNNQKLLLGKSSTLFQRISNDNNSKLIMDDLCNLLDYQSAIDYVDVVINEYISYLEGETIFTIDVAKESFTADITYNTLKSKLEQFGHGVGTPLITKLKSKKASSNSIILNLFLLLYEISISPTNENFVKFMSQLIKVDAKSIFFYSNTIQKLLYFHGDNSSYNMWYNYAYYILFVSADKKSLNTKELLLILSADLALLVNKPLFNGLVNYVCNNHLYVREMSTEICRNPPTPILSTVMQPDKKLVVGNVLWNLNKLVLIPRISDLIWLTNINNAQEIIGKFPSWIETIKRMICTIKFEFLKEEAYNLNVRVQSYIDNVLQLAHKVLRLLSSTTGTIYILLYN